MAYTKQNYQPGDVLTAEQMNKIQDAVIVNEGNIEGHIENKENPHGVTREQINAAPSGFGLGTVGGASTWNGDANALTKQGWHRLESGTTNGVGEAASLRVDGYAETGLTQTAYTLSGLIKQRTCKSGVWSDWVRCDPAAFAPSGYGLGGDAINQDPDTITKTGFYYANIDGALCHVLHENLNANHSIQTAKCVANKHIGSVMQRNKLTNWGEWEWVNPPMELGVEYRTTERWNGKAVYAKRINCLAAPATISITDWNIDQVVRWSGFVTYYGVALPTDHAAWDVEISKSQIVTKSTYTQASAHFYIDLYYTKN